MDNSERQELAIQLSDLGRTLSANQDNDPLNHQHYVGMNDAVFGLPSLAYHDQRMAFEEAIANRTLDTDIWIEVCTILSQILEDKIQRLSEGQQLLTVHTPDQEKTEKDANTLLKERYQGLKALFDEYLNDPTPINPEKQRQINAILSGTKQIRAIDYLNADGVVDHTNPELVKQAPFILDHENDPNHTIEERYAILEMVELDGEPVLFGVYFKEEEWTNLAKGNASKNTEDKFRDIFKV